MNQNCHNFHVHENHVFTSCILTMSHYNYIQVTCKNTTASKLERTCRSSCRESSQWLGQESFPCPGQRQARTNGTLCAFCRLMLLIIKSLLPDWRESSPSDLIDSTIGETCCREIRWRTGSVIWENTMCIPILFGASCVRPQHRHSTTTPATALTLASVSPIF